VNVCLEAVWASLFALATERRRAIGLVDIIAGAVSMAVDRRGFRDLFECVGE
jgi:hypothetical protein